MHKAKTVHRPGIVRRTFRTTLAHLILQLADPHAWNALALVALAGMTAWPAETLAAHPMLRAIVPVLAAIGVAIRAYDNHAAVLTAHTS